MSETSSIYNSMLSNLATGMFKEALISRCARYGIGLHLCNPAFTSVIDMIKFMPKYGLDLLHKGRDRQIESAVVQARDKIKT